MIEEFAGSGPGGLTLADSQGQFENDQAAVSQNLNADAAAIRGEVNAECQKIGEELNCIYHAASQTSGELPEDKDVWECAGRRDFL